MMSQNYYRVVCIYCGLCGVDRCGCYGSGIGVEEEQSIQHMVTIHI